MAPSGQGLYAGGGEPPTGTLRGRWIRMWAGLVKYAESVREHTVTI